MTQVQVIDLVKKFGEMTSVHKVTFIARAGELTTLLGPSGCGKTTTLRMIAGLESPNGGEISLGGEVVASPQRGIHLAAEERNIGMVFQSYAIWPHMTAFENIAYPLRLRKASNNEIETKVNRTFDLLRLRGLEQRLPGQLSGGQQQRVALARALVYEPKMLLLDEPLANLDAKVREVVRFELKELQKRLGFTAIYVTHDQSEAMALSDKIIVMDQGRIVQEGTPADIYERPKARFVAEFVGQSNFISGLAVKGDNGLGVSLPGGYVVPVSEEHKIEPGSQVTISVRPEGLEVLPDGAGNQGLAGIVKAKAYLGNFLLFRIIGPEGLDLHVQLDPQAAYTEGSEVRIKIKEHQFRIFS